MVRGGRCERGSGWGTRVRLWRIQVDVCSRDLGDLRESDVTEHACTWTGRGGELRVGVDQPAQLPWPCPACRGSAATVAAHGEPSAITPWSGCWRGSPCCCSGGSPCGGCGCGCGPAPWPEPKHGTLLVSGNNFQPK